MTAWPRIKLLDARGRTLTVFERMPKPDASATQRPLRIDVVIDKPKSPDGLVADLAAWLLAYGAKHGHWPDAEAIVKQLEVLGTLTREADILRDVETGQVHGGAWHVNPAAMADHIRSNGMDFSAAEMVAHFRGEPRGESDWTPTPPPASRKAQVHQAAAAAEHGFALPHSVKFLRANDFDGVTLPDWDDVQRALDLIAGMAEGTDTLTLTVEQLRRLVVHRC